MLSIFKLTDAINESAIMRSDISGIEPYEFIGSMSECTAEFNYNLLSEAANFVDFYAVSEEIMVEAAINNAGSLDILSENVFGQIKDNVVKFINKIIAMVKGLIEKLKAFFYKLTGKTDKWLNIMRPKIQDAQKRTGAADFTYEMHKWNVDFVNNGLKTAVKSAMDNYHNAFKVEGMNRVLTDADEIANFVRGQQDRNLKKPATDSAGANPDSDATKDKIKKIDNETEDMKKTVEDLKNAYPKTASGWIKSAGASRVDDSSMDALWKSVDAAATGGEKVTVKLVSDFGIDKMVSAIENSKKTIDDLKKYYDDHLKHLSETKKALENQFNKHKEIKEEDKIPTSILTSTRAAMTAYANLITTHTTLAENFCNNARGKNVAYVQNMTSEFMSALSKFSGIKSKKD